MNTSTLNTVAPVFAVRCNLASRRRKSQILTTVLAGAGLLAVVPLVWLLIYLVTHGLGALISASWWTKSQLGIMYSLAGGGALHAIIGTLVQTAIATAIALPIGIFTAIYLVEYARVAGKKTFLGKATLFMVDILSGVPSIVAALFIYSLWIVMFGMDRSGAAVAFALTLLMIPVIVRNTEEMLVLVPQDLREAGLALGLPQWKVILKIVIPAALPGIITGIMLAIARVMGESAPVLILVGSTQGINWDALSGPQSSLPLMMVDMYKAGAEVQILNKMWGAALTLVLIITALNLGARLINSKTSAR